MSVRCAGSKFGEPRGCQRENLQVALESHRWLRQAPGPTLHRDQDVIPLLGQGVAEKVIHTRDDDTLFEQGTNRESPAVVSQDVFSPRMDGRTRRPLTTVRDWREGYSRLSS